MKPEIKLIRQVWKVAAPCVQVVHFMFAGGLGVSIDAEMGHVRSPIVEYGRNR